MRPIILFLLAIVVAGCSHPLDIEGEGDIVELNNSVRGCTLEESIANDIRCENWVVSGGGSYVVRYSAVPRAGWAFEGWEGSACDMASEAPYCEYFITGSLVDAFIAAVPNVVLPPTVAVFERATELSITTKSNPTQDNTRYSVIYTVSNTSDVAQFGTNLIATIPDFSGPVTPARETTPAAICDAGGGTCLAGDKLRWSIGLLDPGEVRVFTLSELVSTLATEGDLMNMDAQVEIQSELSIADAEILVVSENTPELQVAITSDDYLVVAGSDVTHRLQFSNRSATLLADELTVTMDADTSFVSATGGGTFSNGVVTWPVSVGAGGTDTRELTVMVNNDVEAGTLLDSEVQFVDTLSGISASDLESIAVSSPSPSSAPLSLSVIGSADPAQEGMPFTVTYIIKNDSFLPVHGVRLRAIIPNYLDQISPASETIPPAACSSGSSACSAGQSVIWILGSFTAGETRQLSMTENLSIFAGEGELMPLQAIVTVGGRSSVYGASSVVVTAN